MASFQWTITVGEAAAQTPEELGVKISSISLRSLAASSATLSRIAEFDEETDVFTYGTQVVISNGIRVIFRGKIITNPRNANPVQETQEIEILDVWDELERTIYQELWAIGPDGGGEPRSPRYQPRAILGLNPSGAAIATGAQLSLFLDYAQNQAEVGVEIGTYPPGITLWPSQVNNMTVAELIRTTLKYHPNWVTQMDYSSDPVVVNFVKPEETGALSLALDGTDDVAEFSVRQVSERVPECVAITYETSMRVDDDSFRDLVHDVYPEVGNPKSPNSLSVTVPLESGSVVTMKQPIETANLPTDLTEARAWLKAKFPSLVLAEEDVPEGLPADFFSVSIFERYLVEEGDQPEPPVNEDTPRLEVLDFDELPRELVRGTVQDWMQKKARKVEVVFRLKADPAWLSESFIDPLGAAAEQLAKMPSGDQKMVLTCTNAITKVYKGTSSFTPAESAPTGVAQAVYQSLSQAQFEGHVLLKYDEIPNTVFNGRQICLTGGREEWETMAAMVSEVRYDVGAAQVSLAFGPPPFLAPGDWIEMQRALRGRQPTWITNRDSDEPSDGGPEVSGSYDTPISETLDGGGSGSSIYHPFKVTSAGEIEDPEDPEALVQSYNVATGVAGGIEIAGGSMIVPDGYVIYVKIDRNPASRAVTAASRDSASVLPTSDSTSQYIQIAKVDGGQVIQHRFEDIRAGELLIQDAGELLLVTVFDSTNTYALPE
jgi:hypothetical protein